MAQTIGTAYIQIMPSAQGMQGSITNALSDETESAGSSLGEKFSAVFSKGVGEAGGKIGQVGSVVAEVGTKAVAGLAAASVAVAGVGVAAGKAAFDSASSLAQYGDEIDKNSQKLGVSSTFYQEWEAVLQHSGTSMTAMTGTFKTLSKAVESGSKDQQAAFAALGLSMNDLQNMSTEQVFESVIAGLQQMEEGTERTALASTLLGKGAMELGPLMNTSAADTQAMIDKVNELGGVMSEEAVKNAALFQDQLQDLQTAFTGISRGIAAELLPSFADLMGGITGIITGEENANQQLADGINGLIQSMVDGIPQIVDIISTILDAIIDNLPLLMEGALQIILALVTGLIEHLPQLIAYAPQLIIALVEALIEVVPMLLTVGKEIIIQIKDGIESLAASLYTKGASLISTLKDKVSEKIKEFVNIGKNIVEGIKKGVANAWEDFCDWIGSKVSGLVDYVKDKLGIESPSKVFASEVGQWIPKGIAKGIEQHSGAVNDAITDMMTSATDEGLLMSSNVSADIVRSGAFAGALDVSASNREGADIYSLLQSYLPYIADGNNVNVTLEGDANMLFRSVSSVNRMNSRLTGINAMA